jgi:hypothetical protein
MGQGRCHWPRMGGGGGGYICYGRRRGEGGCCYECAATGEERLEVYAIRKCVCLCVYGC